MQRRQHARVRLRLPARLRWVAPLGQKYEICETRNVSRGGLLIACEEKHGLGMPLWVTFPFNPAGQDGQPEVLARVLRCGNGKEGARSFTQIALHFESTIPHLMGGTGNTPRTVAQVSEKRPIAFSIRVRPQQVPWFEEVMTVEVSPASLRFITNREYSVGGALFVSFVSPEISPWQEKGEILAKIIRVENIPQSTSLVITVERIPQ